MQPYTPKRAVLPLTVTPENGGKKLSFIKFIPVSFKDSNGDGIGDLNGITSQLDYIKGLGVDVLWLSPHYDSPNADNGYDIRDYRKIMAEFGTMADFDELLQGIKQRNLKMIVDLVVNHTSDEHIWFVESRKSESGAYSDYYIWREDKDGRPPNNWVSFFSGSAWKKEPQPGQYYLHLFAEKQPDLNWDNPNVRHEVYNIMKFWLDKGIDGFRMDVIPFISKDQTFSDYPKEYQTHPEYIYASGPKLHDYLQEMNREVLSKYDVMTVGEAFGVTLEQTPPLVDERRNELNMIFHFDAVRLNRNGWRWKPWALPDLKSIYARFDRELDVNCWQTVFLSNHDNPRLVSSFGDDSAQYRSPFGKSVSNNVANIERNAFHLSRRRIRNDQLPVRRRSKQFDDIEVRNAWKAEVLTNRVDAEDYLFHMRKTSRDHSRTPMQWDDSPNAGFTTAVKPWFAVHPNFKEINATAGTRRSEVHLSLFKQVIELRKKTPAFIYGDYADLDPTDPFLFAYTRTLGPDQILVALISQRTP